jgi:hypothetical protein
MPAQCSEPTSPSMNAVANSIRQLADQNPNSKTNNKLQIQNQIKNAKRKTLNAQ